MLNKTNSGRSNVPRIMMFIVLNWWCFTTLQTKLYNQKTTGYHFPSYLAPQFFHTLHRLYPYFEQIIRSALGLYLLGTWNRQQLINASPDKISAVGHLLTQSLHPRLTWAIIVESRLIDLKSMFSTSKLQMRMHPTVSDLNFGWFKVSTAHDPINKTVPLLKP